MKDTLYLIKRRRKKDIDSGRLANKNQYCFSIFSRGCKQANLSTFNFDAKLYVLF
jgi:hypothetical protein